MYVTLIIELVFRSRCRATFLDLQVVNRCQLRNYYLRNPLSVGFYLQVERVEGEGYYGGVRLLMATCKLFHVYCSDHDIVLHDRNFTLSYDTTIPRQVLWPPYLSTVKSITLFVSMRHIANESVKRAMTIRALIILFMFVSTTGWALRIKCNRVCGLDMFAGILCCWTPHEGWRPSESDLECRTGARHNCWVARPGGTSLWWPCLHGWSCTARYFHLPILVQLF